MENVPPSSINHGDELPTLDNLLRPRCNVRTARQKRSPAKVHTRASDLEDEDSQPESGLLTPPSSQTQEEDIDPSRMLFSPPPEEVLRQGRNSASRARSVPVQQSFTPSLLAHPPAQSTALSKRKRNAHNRSSSHTALDSIIKEASSSILVTEATPNPKPRKQTKRGSPSRTSPSLEEPTTPTRTASQQQSESPTKRSLLLSPHHSNPNADYIPPLPIISRQTISSRRHSATPIPPYEPPRDQFTPPREIIHTPPRATVSPERMSKSSKRKSTATKKQGKLVLTIKKEPPEIDLSLPPPPPSPSDDPLLLKGLPRRPRTSKLSIGTSSEALDTPASTHARQTPSIASSSVSPSGEVHVSRLPDLNSAMDLSMQNDDDDDFDDSFANAPPLFDLTNAQEDPGVWDDVDLGSDSDDFDQTGEYTGRFKVLTVPTKADPPSSCTRSRQDAWGNPSSPFPGSTGRRSLPSSSSPPLKAVADGEDGAQNESLDEDDVFFLDTPLNASANADMTVREEFQEGSSRDTIDGLAGLDVDLSMRDIPQADYDTSPGQHEVSQERSYTYQEQPHEKSPSPLPIVDTWEQEYDYEQDAAAHSEPHVRFAASRDSLEDVSMEIDDNDDSQDAAPFDADLSYESILHDPDEDQEPSPEAEAPDDSDSSDEETVDRELSREPGQFSDDEDEEEHDIRPKPPVIPTPPRTAYTPARSVSPNAQSTRPKGFLSITSPLRRQKSPQTTQGFQVRDASPLPSIDAVFAAPAPPCAPTCNVDNDEYIPQASNSRLAAETREQIEDEHEMADDQPEEQIATDVGDDSGDESEDLDDGVVKITSDDPRVAARAAAILKMHDYDFIIRDLSRKRRRSDLDSALRNVRRRSTIEGGIAKRGTPRRRTLGGIVGDQVFIPGSPMMTVPELLQQAERTVEQRGRSILHTPSRDGAAFQPLPLPETPAFETPVPGERMRARPMFNASGPRAWEKDDWKLLDACFTDERLARGLHKRLGEATLAPVEDVDLDSVVDRFLDHTGGVPVEEVWPAWTRNDLLRRTYALQKKQRAGKGAPPTPSGRFGSVALSEVPDFTPLPSRQSSVQPGFPRWGSTNGVGSSSTPAVPATLLAPRYSHLLDEAITISRTEFTTPIASHTQPVEYRSASVPVAETRDVSLPPQSPAAALRAESEAPATTMEEEDVSMSMPPPPLPVPRSITSRMKGFFFSYLPKATKSNLPKKPATRAHPGLPIPPPEVFQKSRTIATPVSKPAPKPVPPKDLVNLQHAPLPPSKIPRPAKQQPKRLVELHPAPPPEPRQAASLGRSSVGGRRSSNGSVKDLVRGFEDMEKMHAKERQEEMTRLRRVRSVGEWAAAAGKQGQGQQGGRPGWKP